jgi:hypothetical protein
MSAFDAHPCQAQVPVGRWLLVHLQPDLPVARRNGIVHAVKFIPGVVAVKDLSHCTPEGLSEILAIPDSTIPTREQLAALRPVVQEGLGL